MKLLVAMLFFLVGVSVSGCFQTNVDDDLRSVPITNNPNLFPRSSQTAQNSGFGN